jgi:hypothetical protein
VATLVVGGLQPEKRFDIHRRHYEESLTAAVMSRFPATRWLVGPLRLEAAARIFVRTHPPTAPCIAEYGTAFPGFLETWPGTAHLAYVPAFADLDWHLGRLAVAVDLDALGAEQLTQFDPNELAASVVKLQPGTHYTHASWGIDTLMDIYLADAPLDSWTLGDDDTRLEVRGARGTFRFCRLTAADYAFRTALAAGRTLGHAAALALEIDPTFEAGAGLVTVFQEQLVVAVEPSRTGDFS